MTKSLAIYANASSAQGIGHVIRQDALAQTAVLHGFSIHWYYTQLPSSLCEELALKGYKLTCVDKPEDMPCLWQRKEGVLVIDDYFFPPSLIAELRKVFNCLVLFDDNTLDLAVDVDIVVNPSCLKTLHNANVVLSGSEFRVIRSGFNRRALPSSNRQSPLKALICLGGTDVKNLTPKITSTLVDISDELEIHVLCSSATNTNVLAQLQQLASDGTIVLHVDLFQPFELFSKMDIAVCAAGGVLYELVFLGVPTVALVVADNQSAVLEDKAINRCAFICDMRASGELDMVATNLQHLVHNQVLRKTMSNFCMELIDGKASERIVTAIEDRLRENHEYESI